MRRIVLAFLVLFFFGGTIQSQEDNKKTLNEAITIIKDQDIFFDKLVITNDEKYLLLTTHLDYGYLIVNDLTDNSIKYIIDYGETKPFENSVNFFVLHPTKNEIIVRSQFEGYTRFDSWDLKSGRIINSFNISGKATSFNISNDGKKLVVSFVGDPNYILVLDSKTGHILYRSYGQNMNINFSSDDKYIAFYAMESPVLGGEKVLSVWDYQLDTFNIGWYVHFGSAYFSMDGKNLKFGDFYQNGANADSYYQFINIFNEKYSKKFTKPHLFYDKIKGNKHIQNTGENTFLIKEGNKTKKLSVKKVLKSIDKTMYDIESFNGNGVYDFTNDVSHIIFPAFSIKDNSQAICYFNLKEDKIEKTMPFNFDGAKYISAIDTNLPNDSTRLKIDKEFINSYNDISYDGLTNGLNEFARAEYITKFNQYIARYEKLSNDIDKYYLYQSYSLLAGLYEYAGDYKKADEVFNKMNSLIEKYYMNNFPILRDYYKDLSYFYFRLNNFDQSEKYAYKLKGLIEKYKCENSFEYAVAYKDLAYNEMKKPGGSYEKADSLLTISMNLLEKVGYKESDIYSQIIHTKGERYRKSIDPDNSKQKNIDLFYRANELFSQVKYSNRENLAGLLNSKGLMYLKVPYFFTNTDTISFYLKQAVNTFNEASLIYIEVYSEHHGDYLQSCYNAAISQYVYSCFTKEDKLDPLYLSSYQFVLSVSDRMNYLFRNISFMSEKDATVFLNEEMDDLTSAFLSLANEFDGSYELLDLVYEFSLKTKSLLLKSSTAMRTAILSSGDSALIRDYNKWIDLKQQLNKLYAMPGNARPPAVYRMEEEANSLESQLVKRSPIISELEMIEELTWMQVRDSLKEGEAAIEFLSFNKFNECIPEFTDSILYCASLIRKETRIPELITLFNEKQLINLIGQYGGNNINYINGIYGTGNEFNTKLYELIWKPLEKSLSGIKTVYLSPTGLLNKISFPAIANEKNVLLCDQYNINIESSTGNLVNRKPGILSDSTSAILFGGINYNSDASDVKIWTYLNGTMTETQNIVEALASNNIKSEYFNKNNATEETFKEKAGSHDIVHISTHGFFYPDPEAEITKEEEKIEKGPLVFRGGNRGIGVNAFVQSDNPLMRSGLAMAGANRVWNIQEKIDGEDGVLTAQELAHIDMRNTDLVVLSACETGLGDIKGSEGVYGLQRAFKMAGVDYIIMSLWQVPDKETEEFMTTFYSKLLSLKDIKQAFNQTQKEMRQKYDPYYWAAFVLIE